MAGTRFHVGQMGSSYPGKRNGGYIKLTWKPWRLCTGYLLAGEPGPSLMRCGLLGQVSSEQAGAVRRLSLLVCQSQTTDQGQVALMALGKKLSAVADWLMQPVRRAKRASRSLLVQAIRSRFFWLAAGLSSLALLSEALSATFYAARTGWNDPFLSTLRWAVAVLVWVMFLVTASERYVRLRNKKRG